MGQPQRQQFGVVNELSPETGLQLGRSEQELLTTLFSIREFCLIG
jgi:hypothetical protein